ncbi:hypothetical protein OV203_33685 [Nannocystis sp. ILAH1]|uniref:hypothetical protein n=1 Tax=Nannocystis sp. ILAH1 TaxID=2996789 RepID=UPI00226F6C2E|nr:hypothetical protein [Nannocystis sp. ILAH1]MCY0992138.1 hypothetical protein [Nannocystis sp. ILAH1]
MIGGGPQPPADRTEGRAHVGLHAALVSAQVEIEDRRARAAQELDVPGGGAEGEVAAGVARADPCGVAQGVVEGARERLVEHRERLLGASGQGEGERIVGAGESLVGGDGEARGGAGAELEGAADDDVTAGGERPTVRVVAAEGAGSVEHTAHEARLAVVPGHRLGAPGEAVDVGDQGVAALAAPRPRAMPLALPQARAPPGARVRLAVVEHRDRSAHAAMIAARPGRFDRCSRVRWSTPDEPGAPGRSARRAGRGGGARAFRP